PAATVFHSVYPYRRVSNGYERALYFYLFVAQQLDLNELHLQWNRMLLDHFSSPMYATSWPVYRKCLCDLFAYERERQEWTRKRLSVVLNADKHSSMINDVDNLHLLFKTRLGFRTRHIISKSLTVGLSQGPSIVQTSGDSDHNGGTVMVPYESLDEQSASNSICIGSCQVDYLTDNASNCTSVAKLIERQNNLQLVSLRVHASQQLVDNYCSLDKTFERKLPVVSRSSAMWART
ncbi:MAG: hypothetical protein ACK8QZ_09305, partial [Anaerolineales bacterium]